MTSAPRQPGPRPAGPRRRVLAAGAALLVLAVVSGVAYGLEVRSWAGAVPDDAFVAGADGAGTLYICVAPWSGGQHPGALTEAGVCHVAWGGEEFTVDSDFAVVVGDGGSWVEIAEEGVPEGAFAAGDDRGALYVCRVDGRPGKLSADGFCYIAVDGEERSFTTGYEVLVQ